MNINIHTLNAFTTAPEGGNPAGVCLEAENLTEEQMQKAAREMGFSETAFLLPSDKGDYRVRFFTPTTEVDLCGHATIALFSLLSQKGMAAPGFYTQETAAGLLAIEIKTGHSVMMDQTLPYFGEEADRQEIASSLNIPESELADHLPAQVVSTGLKDLIVPVKSLKTLNSLEADMKKIKEISRQYDVSGYHLFCEETLYGATAHCRNFAPLCGIDEEAATGTATGATTAYMYRHGLLEKSDLENLQFEQGYAMNSPSAIQSSLEIWDGVIKRVRVGGEALITGSRKIRIW